MNIAIVGATGMVGTVALKVLKERNFKFDNLFLVASERSAGKKINFDGKEYTVMSIPAALNEKIDIAIFSAGGERSLEWAPKFAAQGTVVIDNSSAFRMDDNIKLIVSEVNGHILNTEDKIIANPNCSTMQLMSSLGILNKDYGIERLILSTYQSVSGTGVKAVKQMEDERKGLTADMVYPHPIDLNCLPHGGDFLDNGYTTEEMKLVHETRKILDDQSIPVTATVVRVPVVGGHSISVNVTLKNEFDLKDIISKFINCAGITIEDDPKNNVYPMPITAHEKDDIFIGRIRRDYSHPKALNMWIVSDNLRKGAATNTIQIAEIVRELRGI